MQLNDDLPYTTISMFKRADRKLLSFHLPGLQAFFCISFRIQSRGNITSNGNFVEFTGLMEVKKKMEEENGLWGSYLSNIEVSLTRSCSPKYFLIFRIFAAPREKVQKKYFFFVFPATRHVYFRYAKNMLHF